MTTPALSPQRDDIVQGIAVQICPWCGLGPFKMLPVHTNKMHGIDKWELRELAGLSTSDPLCDPEPLQKMSDSCTQGARIADLNKRRSEEGFAWSKPRKTTEGTRRNTESLKAWESKNPERAQEIRARNARGKSPEGRVRISDANRRRMADPDARAKQAAVLNAPEARSKWREAMTKRSEALSALHGTVGSYKRGCRCDSCRHAKAEYRRASRNG